MAEVSIKLMGVRSFQSNGEREYSIIFTSPVLGERMGYMIWSPKFMQVNYLLPKEVSSDELWDALVAEIISNEDDCEETALLAAELL